LNWTDIPRNPSRKTLRQFAAAWIVFCGLLAVRSYRHGYHTLAFGLAIAAVIIGVPGLIIPTCVRWIFVGWMTLAFPIGWLVSQLMMAVMFYVILTPVALIFRIRGRDLLHRNRATNRTSYWLPKRSPEDVRSYFRQH
jgi:hypothetical protein